MGRIKLAFWCIAFCATQASADPLSQMHGTWTGTGWARETPQGPREKIRCKLDNTYEASALELTIKGRCVVPGRKLSLSGRLEASKGTNNIGGRWFNPDGLGSTAITGVQRNNIVAFTFRAKDPETGNQISQNVEWRVEENSLRLRASDRADPSILMSDMTFER